MQNHHLRRTPPVPEFKRAGSEAGRVMFAV